MLGPGTWHQHSHALGVGLEWLFDSPYLSSLTLAFLVPWLGDSMETHIPHGGLSQSLSKTYINTYMMHVAVYAVTSLLVVQCLWRILTNKSYKQQKT